MAYTLILHIQNSDPVVGEVEELPPLSATMVAVKNPRRVDGKDLQYLAEGVVTVYWPLDKLNYIEVVSGEEDEEIIGFVRE